MLLEFVCLSAAEYVVGGIGIKIYKNKQQLQGLNCPVRLPIIDNLLKKKMGTPTRIQRFQVRTLLKIVRNLTRFQCVEYIALGMLNKSSSNKPKRKEEPCLSPSEAGEKSAKQLL